MRAILTLDYQNEDLAEFSVYKIKPLEKTCYSDLIQIQPIER